MDILTTLLIILFCLVMEAFFSGSEIGVVSADKIKLRHEAAKGSKGAKLALEMLKKPEWLLSTTLVGTNIAIVANTTMVTALMLHLFGDAGSWLAVVLAAPLIWVFGEIVPKSIFQQRADSITPITIFALRFFSILFWPILIVFSFVTRMLAKLAGGEERNPFTVREEISTMLQMPATEGDIQPVEKQMIQRLFNFSETRVGDSMRPLIQVTAIDKEVTCGEARRLAIDTSHARLPVFEERIDQIIGILNVLDLLGEPDDKPIAPFIREALYVPETKSVQDLLVQLRQTGEVVAVVVDEFGAAEGIVTVEDIVEEVVEDLSDEYDSKEEPTRSPFQKLDERDYLTSGRTELGEIVEAFGLDLASEEYSTIAGFILQRTGRIPPQGTHVEVGKVTLTVQRGTPRAIEEVRIRWTD